MLRTPINSKVRIALLGFCAQWWSAANAQDFTTQVGTPDPLSLLNVNLVPLGDALSLGPGPGFKGGLAYGLGAYAVYDSNIFLSENDPQSEFSVSLAPWLSYSTDPEGGADFTFSANYHPVIRSYFNNPDLNAVDQSADFSIKVQGSKNGHFRVFEVERDLRNRSA